MKKESELLEQVSRRASVPLTTVRAIVDALRDEARNGNEIPLRGAGAPASSHTDPALVNELISRAQTHRLGVEFLVEGYLASVAAEFGAHAFTVEAARAKLRDSKQTDDAS